MVHAAAKMIYKLNKKSQEQLTERVLKREAKQEWRKFQVYK